MISNTQIHSLMDSQDILIEPYNPADLQPASYDVHLGPEIKFYAHGPDSFIGFQPHDKQHFLTTVDLSTQRFVLIKPGQFCLASLAESITLSPRVGARIEGKSSLGRWGLGVHVTAGFVDPGWSGILTLELVNFNSMPMRLYAGMPIGQVSFDLLDEAADPAYGAAELGSHYQGATTTEGSQIHIDTHKRIGEDSDE